MSKILGRIAIIGLIIWGAWYLLNEKEIIPKNEFVEIEETEIPAKKEENLTFEIKKGNKKSTNKEIQQNVAKKVIPTISNDVKKINIKPIVTENIVPVDTEKLTNNISKFAEKSTPTVVNVYFYDYEIDLSSNTIPAGNVVFRAMNNGRLSHNLTLKDGNGQVNFGRIAPGETVDFKTNLDSGNFEILSLIRIDQEKEMTETLTVQ